VTEPHFLTTMSWTLVAYAITKYHTITLQSKVMKLVEHLSLAKKFT